MKESMVILAFADRWKVVSSLKVMPSEAPVDVCTVSLRKMSSLSLSAIEFLLRMTVAVPTSVATLPIGSSARAGEADAEGAGEASGAGVAAGCVGEGDGVGSGCACANCILSALASSPANRAPSSSGGSIAGGWGAVHSQ